MAEFMDIPLGLILPSPFQMRSHMDADKLDQLGESLKRDGQQRPVKVRLLPDGEYELVFGHRTVLAAKQAGFETVKAIIEDFSDEEVMLAQYAENEYREDISDYDRARWLQAMIDQFGYTQTQLAEKIGQNQPWISHHLAILKLDGIMAHAIISNMTEFQARAILRVPEDLLPTVCREVEEHCEAHGELPSTSVIASIVQSIEFYSDIALRNQVEVDEPETIVHGGGQGGMEAHITVATPATPVSPQEPRVPAPMDRVSEEAPATPTVDVGSLERTLSSLLAGEPRNLDWGLFRRKTIMWLHTSARIRECRPGGPTEVGRKAKGKMRREGLGKENPHIRTSIY